MAILWLLLIGAPCAAIVFVVVFGLRPCKHEWVLPEVPPMDPRLLAIAPTRIEVGVKRCACGATRKVYA